MHLSDYMRKLKLSDEEVAKKIGRSRSSVSRIRRKLQKPDWDTIAVIRRETGGLVTADDFVYGK
jgi:transcriptional regulator with XRE-family HTH domain